MAGTSEPKVPAEEADIGNAAVKRGHATSRTTGGPSPSLATGDPSPSLASALESAMSSEDADECPIGDGSGSGLSTDEIVGFIREMQAFAGTVDERRINFRKSMKTFRDACPTLFEMACKPGIDMRMLGFMLKTRDSVGAGEENRWAADKIVGRRLAGIFLPEAARGGS